MDKQALLKLARAWRYKGNLAAATAGLHHLIALDRQYAPAYVELASLLLQQGQCDEALPLLAKALALDPGDQATAYRYAYLKDLCASPTQQTQSAENGYLDENVLADNPRGKINMRDQFSVKAHRSGWRYAMQALEPLHNSSGVFFDGFIERNFAWRHRTSGIRPPEVLNRMKSEGTFAALATSEEMGITPYLRPWTGFMHNPPNMPRWFHYDESPQAIFAKEIWRKSSEHCLGLFAASEYQAAWLRQQTELPVSVLILPTEIPQEQFSFERFLANENKKIVQVGWWLRKLQAIYQAPIPRDNPLGYEKIRLVPHFFADADNYLRRLLAQEAALNNAEIDPLYAANTREIQHLANDEFDKLLAQNIVFIEFYDASGNNAVVECIARATPILVNPLPAVVEYLGVDYPFYFSDLQEAAAKAQDKKLIREAHRYLQNCATLSKLNGDFFRRSFEQSEVYQLI